MIAVHQKHLNFFFHLRSKNEMRNFMVIVKNNNQKFVMFMKTELFFGLMGFGRLFFVSDFVAYVELSTKYHHTINYD